MKGLELSREYFHKTVKPQLSRDFPDLYPRLAAGLAGNGSECFGYDDEISRDHDWGVDFYIWTLEDDRAYIEALSEWKLELLDKYPPEYKRTRSEYGARIAVMTCGDFYKQLTGLPICPETIREWIQAPEENFALAVNGEVFLDLPGEFTSMRKALLGYYPEDIRKKKISACCMALAQTGQYNHERTLKRNDPVTLRTVLSRFCDSAISMVFLLNKVYKPYYKWAFRALTELPILGGDAGKLLLALAETGGLDRASFQKQRQYILKLCELFACELRLQGLAYSEDWFLTTQGEEVRSGIKDEFLRSLPAQYQI